jgi:hypothetical protein
MKTALVGIVSIYFGTGVVVAATSGPAIPAYVTAAVADPLRPPMQAELDSWRKPAEVIAFAGAKPGDRIGLPLDRRRCLSGAERFSRFHITRHASWAQACCCVMHTGRHRLQLVAIKI